MVPVEKLQDKDELVEGDIVDIPLRDDKGKDLMTKYTVSDCNFIIYKAGKEISVKVDSSSDDEPKKEKLEQAKEPARKRSEYRIKDLTDELNAKLDEKNQGLVPTDDKFTHWSIECHVQQKFETIKMRTNGRRILKFNIVDMPDDDAKSSSTAYNMIECISYEETVDRFEPVVREGAYFRISNAEIARANKKHTQVKNDFRLIMTEHSKIEEVRLEDFNINSNASQ